MMMSPGWWRLAAPAAVLLGGAGVALTVLALRRTTAPVGDVMEAAGRVAAGDYKARVRERGPAEARDLARAFNLMTERLQANDEQRRRLLADITHELRTPLAVVQGNLEGLLDGVYPRDEAHLSLILDETRVLSRLIEDLRTLALAESGALHLQREPTDLEVLAEEAAASFQAQAKAAGVELRVENLGEVPLAEVDPVRVREVLTNLISNALRHTPAGGAVAVRLSTGADGRQVTVAVRDTGAGIPPDALPHIFDRFYKSDESRGMGLGLAIAKNLVEAHGGEIQAASAPGQGTTLSFTLPPSS
jgi:signal transduction histidine kinase